MRTVRVELPESPYTIVAGAGIIKSEPAARALCPLVDGRTVLVVSDSHVAPLYADAVVECLNSAGAESCPQAGFEAGEASKNLATLEELYHRSVAAGLTRASLVVALGGGVVGDVAGFLAATYMRGIPLIQIPTSLLAMVDSSVGGKTAVDLPEGKNLVGAFHQPCLVLADVACLDTLPDREMRCGFAEIAKYALIMDAPLVERLIALAPALKARDPEALTEVVAICCAHKADVVTEDEREKGRRAILNYGHTFGHALEVEGGFAHLNHGEAVAIGMAMAADLALHHGMISTQVARRQAELLAAYDLPAAWDLPGVSAHQVLQTMYRDKKVLGRNLRLVLPVALGEVCVMPWENDDAVLRVIEARRVGGNRSGTSPAGDSG